MQRWTAGDLCTGKQTAAVPCKGTTRSSRSNACKASSRLMIRAHMHGGGANGSDNNSTGSSPTTLAAHRTWLRRQRVLHSEPHPSDGDIIELNVAGCVMVASRSTLRQVPGSLLGLLFDPANSSYLVSDAAGRVFFDYDPAAFALVLRYLRELRVTGGCASSVLLPPIPPNDAGPFRSLVSYLGLQIDEAAITAATARGAAIAAAGAGSSGGGSYYAPNSTPHAGGYSRPSGSPYASRPAAAPAHSSGSHCAQSHPQPHQRQWQQQQQLMRPQPPEVPPSGVINSGSVAASNSSIRLSAASMPSSSSSSSGRQGGPSAAAAAAMGTKKPPPQQQQAYLQMGEPVVQYFYLRTSKAAHHVSSLAAGSASPVTPPLNVTVFTESDVSTQQAGSSSKGSSNSQSGFYSSHYQNRNFNSGVPSWRFPVGFDVFCSTSSSKQLMVFSMVARSSAAVDNVFVGVTSANHIDQRGLQIPSFGWRQLDMCSSTVSCEEQQCSAVNWDVQRPLDNTSTGPETLDRDSSSSSSFPMLWQSGDLVQLIVELGNINKLLLKVNGCEVNGCCIDLPTFRQWCWYVAVFRGTEVVSVVFEQGSVAVYAGDHMLKRYLA